MLLSLWRNSGTSSSQFAPRRLHGCRFKKDVDVISAAKTPGAGLEKPHSPRTTFTKGLQQKGRGENPKIRLPGVGCSHCGDVENSFPLLIQQAIVTTVTGGGGCREDPNTTRNNRYQAASLPKTFRAPNFKTLFLGLGCSRCWDVENSFPLRISQARVAAVAGDGTRQGIRSMCHLLLDA